MLVHWLQEGLGLLNQIQRKWVYLEPIFGRGALPAQQVGVNMHTLDQPSC